MNTQSLLCPRPYKRGSTVRALLMVNIFSSNVTSLVVDVTAAAFRRVQLKLQFRAACDARIFEIYKSVVYFV